MTALSIATAAISFGVGYVAQLFVKATPFDDDPRSVSGTHVLYTVDELKKLPSNKERVDAYYNKRADLHDVLEAVVGSRDAAKAYTLVTADKELQLLAKAIREFYPDVAAPLEKPPAPPPPAPPLAPPPPIQTTPIPSAIVAPMGGGHLQFGGEMPPLVVPPAVPASIAVGL
jgi:hypothetical protein